MGKCILAGHPPVGGQIGYGTYTGNGAASQFINLGVTPKWVLVIKQGTWWYNSYGNQFGSGLAVCGSPATCSYGTVVSITTNGFYVYYDTSNYNIMANASGGFNNYIYGT